VTLSSFRGLKTGLIFLHGSAKVSRDQPHPHAYDNGIAYGAQITPYYDPLLAKIIAHGCNRAVAIRRMQSALANTRIDGLHTNIALHQQIMDDPQFQAGAVDTDFLMRMLNP